MSSSESTTDPAPSAATPAIRPPYLDFSADVLALVARAISGASIRWIDSQPDTCQRIYFANHTSHLDALVLWSALPANVRRLTRPVAAKDYWIKTRLRRFMSQRLFEALLIDRDDVSLRNNPIKIMLDTIGEKYSLILFPEGHRNTADELDEFKSGLYYLSRRRPDLELIPVYIDNMNRILPRGEVLPVPLLSCITFGPPMWIEDKEPKNEFLYRTREAVRRLRDIGND